MNATTIDITSAHNPYAHLKPVKTEIQGEYTLTTYATRVPLLRRIEKFAISFFVTLFSLGFSLISKWQMRQWKEALTPTRNIITRLENQSPPPAGTPPPEPQLAFTHKTIEAAKGVVRKALAKESDERYVMDPINHRYVIKINDNFFTLDSSLRVTENSAIEWVHTTQDQQEQKITLVAAQNVDFDLAKFYNTHQITKDKKINIDSITTFPQYNNTLSKDHPNIANTWFKDSKEVEYEFAFKDVVEMINNGIDNEQRKVTLLIEDLSPLDDYKRFWCTDTNDDRWLEMIMNTLKKQNLIFSYEISQNQLVVQA